MQSANQTYTASECPFCHLPQDAERLSRQQVFAVNDRYPVSKGHALIIPRRHVTSVFELTPAEWSEVGDVLQRLRDKLDHEYAPEGYNIGINDGIPAGQTVAHLHIHVIPRYTGDVADPRGGVRWVLPTRADYWSKAQDA